MVKMIAPELTPFDKYASYGNHFVLIDEVRHTGIAEHLKPDFVRRVADARAGVGADSVIFLQRRREQEGIYVARFFEPNGDEFLNCGNGLACLALHLRMRYGLERAKILVEMPARWPSLTTISCTKGISTVSIRPDFSRIREFIRVPPGAPEQVGGHFPVLQLDCGEGRKRTAIAVYTGEPHLVLFGDGDDTQKRTFFARLPGIGSHINRQLRHIFPQGINVNLARIGPQRNSFEYCCFERGLMRGTLACGTGAIAVGLAAYQSGLCSLEQLYLLPYLARCESGLQEAEIRVTIGEEKGCTLSTRAEYVFQGTFYCQWESPE